jgi:sulfur relay (sulfurtransferase) complex TusBCD TusD component (DsrE family)
MTARGIEDGELVPGAVRKTLADLAAWTAVADKVVVF